MISDEPDEDADNLDDDRLLDAFIDTPRAATASDAVIGPRDWPPRRSRLETAGLDADILDWFKMNHQDWQRQIRCVLRAWIATRPNGGPSAPA